MGLHDLGWIEAHLPDDGSINLTDISAGQCCIGLWGPRARDLLSRVCEDDLRDAGFPYMTVKPITIAELPALALRISYVGEPGWEIYAAVEQGLRLWDILWEAGGPFGVIAAGGGAFDSLRLEKGYRLWGQDIHTEYNPYEAGIGFAVRMDKGDFIGPGCADEGARAGYDAPAVLHDAGQPRRGRHGQGADHGRRPRVGLCNRRQLRPLNRTRHRIRLPANRPYRSGNTR